MNDWDEEDWEDETTPAEVVSDKIPVYPASDGTTYMHTAHVVRLLRVLANSCRDNADNPDLGLLELAEIIEQEADSIDIRAIAATNQ